MRLQCYTYTEQERIFTQDEIYAYPRRNFSLLHDNKQPIR